MRPSSVVIEGQTIVEVDAGDGPGSASEPTIDLDGLFVLPGLADLHVHVLGEPRPSLVDDHAFEEPLHTALFRAARNLDVALRAGVTVVRDVGAHEARSFIVRSAVERGIISGPDVVACGRLITAPGGHAFELGREVESDAHALRAAVRDEISAGADFIKIVNFPVTYSVDQIRAVADEAHAHGRQVACHTGDVESMEIAIWAGVDSVEHGAPLTDELADHLLACDHAIVPTYVTAVETCRDRDVSRVTETELRLVFEPWLRNLDVGLPIAIRKGVRIAAGSDAGFPPLDFGAVVEEILLLHAMGLDAHQSIATATHNAAPLLNREGTWGEIAPGYAADVIAVADDPLARPETLREVLFVMKHGEIVKQPRWV